MLSVRMGVVDRRTCHADLVDIGSILGGGWSAQLTRTVDSAW